MILFAFGCSKADLQSPESIDSQIDEIDVTLYLLTVTAGYNAWVSLNLTEPSDYLAYQNLQNRFTIHKS